MTRLTSAIELEGFRDKILSQRKPEKTCISICGGTGCHAYRCEDVTRAFKKEIKWRGLSSEVELKIYNSLGREIVILMNEIKSPGIYEIIWEGKDNRGKKVTSGTYLYQLKAGKSVQTKRMLFIR